MMTESDIRESESIEAVIEEYEGLTIEEVLELEALAFKHYSVAKVNGFCTEIEELEKQWENVTSRMGVTNWETAMERVEGYVCGKIEPLIEIGLTRDEERALDDANIAINDAIRDLKSVEAFDSVVSDLNDVLFALEQLRDRAEYYGHV